MPNPYSMSGLFAQQFAQMFGPASQQATPDVGSPESEQYAEPFSEERPTSEVTPGAAPEGIAPGEIVEETQIEAATTAPIEAVPTPAVPTEGEPYTEGAPPATAQPETADDWEEIWRKEYDVEAKDIIGEDTYNKLKALSEENLSPGQIFGLMGVLATNPTLGMQMIESKEARKSDALKALTTLEQTAAGVRKTGMTELARTKRWEARIAEREQAIGAKASVKERGERGKYAQDVLGAVREEGLPQGLVNPPTEAQLEDPKLFWEEWYPGTNEAISKYVGKQKILGWLYDKSGPAWLVNQIAIDPAKGIEHFLEDSGFFDTKEINDLKASGILDEFSAAAGRQKEEQQAGVSLIRSKVDKNRADINKLNQQVDYYKERVKNMGRMTPKERYGLLTEILRQRRLTQEKMSLFGMQASWYAQLQTKESKRDYSQIVESYASGVDELTSVLTGFDEIEEQIRQEMVNETMTVNEALPIAASEATQNVMQQYSGLFASPDELFALVYSDEVPSDPQMMEARNFFFINLLTGIHQYSNVHPNDIVSLLDVEGQSLIDAYAGQDVTIPSVAAPMAGQQLRGQGQ